MLPLLYPTMFRLGFIHGAKRREPSEGYGEDDDLNEPFEPLC